MDWIVSRVPAISVARVEGSALVTLAGDQDLQVAGALDLELSRLVEEGVAVQVDMTGVTLVDSTVLGALVRAERGARQAGVDFRVVVGSRSRSHSVRVLLGVVGLLSGVPSLEPHGPGDVG